MFFGVPGGAKTVVKEREADSARKAGKAMVRSSILLNAVCSMMCKIVLW